MKLKIKQFSLLVIILAVSYGIYLCLYVGDSLHQSKILADDAKQLFYSLPLNNKIDRVGPVYGDSCLRSFYIEDYPMPTLIVSICRYPTLKKVVGKSRIIKKPNTNECNFITQGADTISMILNF